MIISDDDANDDDDDDDDDDNNNDEALKNDNLSLSHQHHIIMIHDNLFDAKLNDNLCLTQTNTNQEYIQGDALDIHKKTQ